uniref:Afadin n=1 Tax=Panagrellus redivivus TaxID=6233 RepID=A0A7E4W752_PANRE
MLAGPKRRRAPPPPAPAPSGVPVRQMPIIRQKAAPPSYQEYISAKKEAEKPIKKTRTLVTTTVVSDVRRTSHGNSDATSTSSSMNSDLDVSPVARGIGDNHCGIYVKKVVDNSAAKRDGRLELGDQLLSVNGNSLIGITQEEAAQKISSAGADVRFEVSKRAAFYNGIVDSLEKHSPNGSHPPPMHHNNNNIPQVGYKHARSASASELFAAASQNSNSTTTDSGSMASGPTVMNSRLPSHYKTANRAPVVIQPQRPGAVSPSPLRKSAASPTPLYSQMERRNASGNYYAQPVTSTHQYQRSASTVPFSATAPKQPWLDNYANLPSIPSNGAGPHFRQASTGSSPLPAPPRPQESHIQPIHTSYFPPAPVRPLPASTAAPTGRLSAPIFDHPARNYAQAPPSRALTLDELDAELEAIESKGANMTDADRARYFDLLNRISELGGRAPASGVHEAPRQMSKPNYTLPFMNEMASKLEEKKQRVEAGTTFGSNHRGSAERLIDDVTQQVERLNTSTDDEEVFHGRHHFTNEASTSSAVPAATPTRPAVRDKSVSPEDKSKKRVQFADDSEVEPRVQIVGKNEVYNDPRQRRLNEIQAKQRKPAVDGANMAFRDKMKMFATQLGEGAARDRLKSSSAQREIELGVSNEAS